MLDFCHVTKAKPTRSLVDHMEGHLRGAEDKSFTIQFDSKEQQKKSFYFRIGRNSGEGESASFSTSQFNCQFTLRLTLRLPVMRLKSYSKGVRRGFFPRCKSEFAGRTRFRQAG